MALTITQSKRNNVVGSRITAFVYVTFDGSYPTGGEEFDATAYVGTPDSVDIVVKTIPNKGIGGLLLRYDYANKKIMAFASSTEASGNAVTKNDAATAGGLALIEIANTSNFLQDATAEIIITGGR